MFLPVDDDGRGAGSMAEAHAPARTVVSGGERGAAAAQQAETGMSGNVPVVRSRPARRASRAKPKRQRDEQYGCSETVEQRADGTVVRPLLVRLSILARVDHPRLGRVGAAEDHRPQHLGDERADQPIPIGQQRDADGGLGAERKDRKRGKDAPVSSER